MAKAELVTATNVFIHPETGKPVSLGNVYIGQPDLDPEILANRISIEIVQESGTVVQIPPTAQPLTMTSGVIIYQGSPVNVLVDGVYSLKITDSLGGQLYYLPRKNETAVTSTETGVIPTNGSFEFESAVTTKPDNWSIVESTGGTIVTDTDSAHGLKSLRFTGTDGTGAGTATSDRFDVLAGGNVVVNFTYKATAVDVQNKIDINWYNSANALITSTNVLNEGASNPLTYTTFDVLLVTPSAAKTAEIVITGIAATGSITVGNSYFDAISAVSGSISAGAFILAVPELLTSSLPTTDTNIGSSTLTTAKAKSAIIRIDINITSGISEFYIASSSPIDVGSPSPNRVMFDNTRNVFEVEVALDSNYELWAIEVGGSITQFYMYLVGYRL